MNHPIKVSLTLESTKAGPTLAQMIGQILAQHGATVTYANGDKPSTLEKVHLEGLQIEFVRTVWTVDREKMLAETEEFYDLISKKLLVPHGA
jgi:hypothetical protein